MTNRRFNETTTFSLTYSELQLSDTADSSLIAGRLIPVGSLYTRRDDSPYYPVGYYLRSQPVALGIPLDGQPLSKVNLYTRFTGQLNGRI